MDPKPLAWSPQYGAVFADPEVVDVYHFRPPYPEELIVELVRLAGGGRVLDVGCGTGDVARRLAPHVDHVDAVDVSAAMLAAARNRPVDNVSWIFGRVEEVELSPPYALVSAGESIHWFDWGVALPRFAELLTPGASLAVLGRSWLSEQLEAVLAPVYRRHSWNTDFEPRDPVTELERRGLFVPAGERKVEGAWRPTIDELVGVHFSTSGLARTRLRDPDAFAAELRARIAESCEERDGRYELPLRGRVTWGTPTSRPAA
jgi:SAM-dependent methyltransferase